MTLSPSRVEDFGEFIAADVTLDVRKSLI